MSDSSVTLMPEKKFPERCTPTHCTTGRRPGVFQASLVIPVELPSECEFDDFSDRIFTGPGLRSLFVGFETLTPANLRRSGKRQNLGRDYSAAIAVCSQRP